MDSVHGLCDIDDHCRGIVDTPAFQRMRWIRQAGLAYLVYPGCEHSRFTHLLGTHTLARRVFQHLRSLRDDLIQVTPSPSDLDDDLQNAFVSAALCHDLGHTAFSHALETVLLPKDFSSHEDCTLALIQGEPALAKEIAAHCDIDQVIQLLKGEHWVLGLCELLSGDFDVDRCDYLLRDAHAAGVVYGIFDLSWIIHSTSLRSRGHQLRVHLDDNGSVARDDFRLARIWMYKQIYFHRTVRGAERLLRAVFERAINRANRGKRRERSLPPCLASVLENRRPTIGEFLATDDVSVMSAIKHWARSADDPVLRYLSDNLLHRKLPKCARSWPGPIPDGVRDLAIEAVKHVFRRLCSTTGIDMQEINEAADYLVLTDNCSLACGNTDREAQSPGTVQMNERDNFDDSLQEFTESRLYVPAVALDEVKRALGGHPQ